MRVLYHDAAGAHASVESELGLEFVPAEKLLREADFVSLHVPLLDATRKMIGEPSDDEEDGDSRQHRARTGGG